MDYQNEQVLPEGGCEITDQIIVNMEYNGYLCRGNFRMLISQIPNSLKFQRSHAYSWWDFSFYPGLSFCCCFFQIWHWIKWEVNMWCHNDQRSFWIEKKWLRSNSYLWLYWNLLDEKEMKLIQFTFYFSGHLSNLWDGCSWWFPLKEDTS